MMRWLQKYEQNIAPSSAHMPNIKEASLTMTNVIKFPERKKPAQQTPGQPIEPKTAPSMLQSLRRKTLKAVWYMTVLSWPLLRWVLAFDVTIQFIRMLIDWNHPDTYSGWRFLLHFSVFSALTYYVSLYDPDDKNA